MAKCSGSSLMALTQGKKPRPFHLRARNRLSQDDKSDIDDDEADDKSDKSSLGTPDLRRKYIRLNISGWSYQIRSTTVIRNAPHSLLGRLARATHERRVKLADDYLAQADEFYFERSPQLFEPVFKYFATGALHLKPDVCQDEFLDEIAFWRISKDHVAPCCADELFPRDDVGVKVAVDEFKSLCFADRRRRLWGFLTGSTPTRGSRFFELTSTLFVFCSIISLTLSSIPQLKMTAEVNETWTDATTNVTSHRIVPKKVINPIFDSIEQVCVIWFSFEMTLRFVVAPRKLRFLSGPMTLVDILAIFPFYLDLLLHLSGANNDDSSGKVNSIFMVVRVLRVMRVIRVMKLGRFSSGLQTFALTMQRSMKQLQMMLVVLLTGVVFFSTLIYYIEKDHENTPFDSIPSAYWWCIVTMTTVGYGDVVPVSIIGKVAATFAIMLGVLVLALPVTIIIDNFIKVSQMEAAAAEAAGESLNDNEAVKLNGDV